MSAHDTFSDITARTPQRLRVHRRQAPMTSQDVSVNKPPTRYRRPKRVPLPVFSFNSTTGFDGALNEKHTPVNERFAATNLESNSSEDNHAHFSDRDLERKAPLSDLRTRFLTQPDALPAVSSHHSRAQPNAQATAKNAVQLTSSETRERNPLDECTQADNKEGVQVYDFAYASGRPSQKRVRFAAHSDHAPSMHYPSSSEDTTAPTRNSIDIDENQPPVAGGGTSRALSQAKLEETNETVTFPILPNNLPAHNPIWQTENRTFILPATTYKPPVAINRNAAANTSKQRALPANPTPRKHPRIQDQTRQEPTTHKRSHSRDLLRRASDSIAKFAAARAGTAPVNSTGVLDRGFQFPLRSPEQRVSSAPDLRARVDETAKGHKRRSSLSRLLDGFGGQGGARVRDGDGAVVAKDQDGLGESLGWRVSTRLSNFIVRRGW